MNTAKKFVDVHGFSSVFNYKTGISAGNVDSWKDYDISFPQGFKSGATGKADWDSILYIHDDELGNFIWAKGQIYNGNDFDLLDVEASGDKWIGATARQVGDYNFDIDIWHTGPAESTGGVTGANRNANNVQTGDGYIKQGPVSSITYDAHGHVTAVGTTGYLNTGVTASNEWIVVGKTGNQQTSMWSVGHKDQANLQDANLISITKTVEGATSAHEHRKQVVVTNPVLNFDKKGHLTKTGSTSYTITPADLGLDDTMHFIGVVDPPASGQSPQVVDGGTKNPVKMGGQDVYVHPGDIVLQTIGSVTTEFVWDTTGHWRKLGDESMYLVGATGDKWIKAYEQDNIVFISHNGVQSGASTTTGIITKVERDANGHVVSVGSTGHAIIALGATGTAASAQGNEQRVELYNNGTVIGKAILVGHSGIAMYTDTSGKIHISSQDKVFPKAITGSTYVVAQMNIAGATYTLYGKDTHLKELNKSMSVVSGTTTSSATQTTQIVETLGGETKSITHTIESRDKSIQVGTSGSGDNQVFTIDYTGISTPDDWTTL